MKKLLSLLVLLGIISISFNNLFAYESEAEDSSSSITSTSDDSYSNYYNEFKKEFYSDLTSWNLSKIDEKIKGYQADVDYLNSNSTSEHYKNVDSYKLKIKVLTDLKNNFNNTTSSLWSSSEVRMCTMDYNPVCGVDNKTYWNACSAGETKIKYKGECKWELDSAENKPEISSEVKDIMNSLENDIKSLRDSVTKDNIEDVKAQAEKLKREYLDKIEAINPNLQEMITKRFDIFFKNWLMVKEMNQNKDNKIDKVDKKNTIWMNQNNQSLKLKYKESLKTKFNSKLESFTDEQLKTVVSKIDILINQYKEDTSKSKLVVQLDALKEVINDILYNRETSIEIENILNSVK